MTDDPQPLDRHPGLLLALGALLSACGPPAGSGATLPRPTGPKRHGRVLLALALSGGGSRAAYFGAAVLEALHREELTLPQVGRVRILDEVDYLSAVSGGSLAAAWHATHLARGKGRRAGPAHFAELRRRMALDIQGQAIRRLFSLARRQGEILLGDGGIYDNLGVEAVAQRLLVVLEREPCHGAVLVVVDAERPYRFAEGLRLVEVIHALAEARARALSRIVFRTLAEHAPRRRPLRVITLRLREGARRPGGARSLSAIPTAFRIAPAHPRLVRAAAMTLVRRHRRALAHALREAAR